MTTRNRTSSFVHLRKLHKPLRPRNQDPEPGELNGKHADKESLLSPISNNENDDGTSPHRIAVAPLWMTVIDDINYDLSRIKKKLAELLEKHNKHLTGGNFDDTDRDKQAIEILTAGVTKLFQLTKGKIKGIGNEKVNTAQEEQVRANLQGSLAQQLQELSVTFKRTQKDYLQKMQGRQQKGNVLLDEYKATYGQNMPKMGFDETQMATVDTNRQMMEERDKEIRKIAQSINDIVQIFKDMNDLIVEQGTILDRIDQNLESAERTTHEAVIQLQEANKELKSARTKYCMLFLCLAVIVMVFIVALRGVFKLA